MREKTYAGRVTELVLLSLAALMSMDGAQGTATRANPSPASSELELLKEVLAKQQRQIDDQQRQIQELREILSQQGKQQGEAPRSSIAAPAPPEPRPAPQVGGDSAAQASPLQIRIGEAAVTPIGFMDLTNTWRSTNAGTSLQTNFGSIPYNNTLQGRLTENKWSAENSRIGFRVDAKVGGANVLGYFEGDFVGGSPANNTQVSSNSALFRIRQYYVDVRKGFWEVLAGQAWSMIVPNRKGMSPLPADLFYTHVVDVNYTNGLYWDRTPGIRFIGHPSKKVSFGIALENSTQYFGGSGGGGVPTLPDALSAIYNGEVDNSVTNDRATPNVHPDILAKFVIEPSPRFHFEVGGVESTVRTFNPNTNRYFTKAGGALTLSINAELVRNLRVVTNNFWGDGAGRYLFGAVPNFIIRADGSPSLMHSASTVSGFEATVKNFSPYIYYGGVYAGRNTALDANGKSWIGYGYPGSPNSQNRSIQEITAGWTQTLWRDAKYGALQYMAQYAYIFRNPWHVAPNAPKNAHETAIWFNLRYVLPGTAPTVRY